ncbi:peptidoglycan recognition protein family protein [Gracilibacillus dipsosauri]|uniref:N-acetylmuramoyl-L-alanine amidase n=1 Tax=Gracilibacillus dipsosauri TaxID=178340 RepID=A0A317KTJ1_9BACI|nr:N-acetylmuramoyl-L-alanine amidase [Gracilibacillus dipsosauri]PWU66593.1 hypothetical protein DLJ74_19420 [Gracilibacillus dipsosauri]
MVKIKKWILPNDVAKHVVYGFNNQKKTITVHQTGNTSKGADAKAHAKLQLKGNSRNASWHYQVDNLEVIQSFEDNAQCWHAGDGRGPGNLNSIAVELCINSDGDYKKTLENGAELVRHLMDKYNLSINDVKQHYNWSGKNCPAQIRANKDGISWSDFLNMVKRSGKQIKTSSVSNSVLIETGGLGMGSIKEVVNYCMDKGWAFSIKYDGDGNPKATVGRLNTSMQREFESFLKKQDWYYKIIE